MIASPSYRTSRDFCGTASPGRVNQAEHFGGSRFVAELAVSITLPLAAEGCRAHYSGVSDGMLGFARCEPPWAAALPTAGASQYLT
jgi:hypothetical protein